MSRRRTAPSISMPISATGPATAAPLPPDCSPRPGSPSRRASISILRAVGGTLRFSYARSTEDIAEDCAVSRTGPPPSPDRVCRAASGELRAESSSLPGIPRGPKRQPAPRAAPQGRRGLTARPPAAPLRPPAGTVSSLPSSSRSPASASAGSNSGLRHLVRAMPGLRFSGRSLRLRGFSLRFRMSGLRLRLRLWMPRFPPPARDDRPPASSAGWPASACAAPASASDPVASAANGAPGPAARTPPAAPPARPPPLPGSAAGSTAGSACPSSDLGTGLPERGRRGLPCAASVCGASPEPGRALGLRSRLRLERRLRSAGIGRQTLRRPPAPCRPMARSLRCPAVRLANSRCRPAGARACAAALLGLRQYRRSRSPPDSPRSITSPNGDVSRCLRLGPASRARRATGSAISADRPAQPRPPRSRSSRPHRPPAPRPRRRASPRHPRRACRCRAAGAAACACRPDDPSRRPRSLPLLGGGRLLDLHLLVLRLLVRKGTFGRFSASRNRMIRGRS